MPENFHFLIFGEDISDQLAIKNLILAVLEGRSDVSASIRRKPLILSRNAERKRRKMGDEIASFWRKECKVRRGCKTVVVAHRDCDALEPAHVSETSSLQAELERAGIRDPVAATPAWEIEAWWMLFPEAVASTRKCWNSIAGGSGNVGKIRDAKESLRRALRPQEANVQKRCKDYVESDGIIITQKIIEQGLRSIHTAKRSESFDAFRLRLIDVTSSKPA